MDQTLLLVILGAAAAGFVQGLSGFAFGLTSMAFWAWSVPPQLAGPLVVFGSLVGQLMAMGSLRRQLDLRRTAPFVIGGVIGVPIGAALLPLVDQTVFKALVGVLLVVWCPTMLFARSLPRIERGGRLADGTAGMVGGLMGGIGGLTGPAPTLWCTLRGWDKDVQRATFQAFNLCMHSLTFTVYVATGIVTSASLHFFAIVLPAMLVPAFVGMRAYRRFSDAAFRRLVLILLMVSGVVLLGFALPRLFG